MSYDDATQKCAEIGRRICTKDELVGGVCCGSGGMCNKYEVWSSSSSGMQVLFKCTYSVSNFKKAIMPWKMHPRFNWFLGWTQEHHMFCKHCSSFYETVEEAKTACENESNCEAVYDLFCDGIGSFCTCNTFSVVRQTHPKGMDCVLRKPRDP